MTLILKQLFGLIKLLNSDTGLWSLTFGVTFGFVLGMIPFLSLQSLVLWMVILFFRVQIGAATISAFFFSLVAYILDPAFHWLGSLVLSAESLQGFFTILYNAPLIPYTRFNQSTVMGASLLGIALSPLIFFPTKWAILKYREKVVARFKQSKYWKWVERTALFKWYAKYDSLYNV